MAGGPRGQLFSLSLDRMALADTTELAHSALLQVCRAVQWCCISSINEKKLTGYILDNTKNKKYITEFIANKLELEISIINLNKEVHENFNEELILPSVYEWLSFFRDAEYVVTDSFHGVVFCIIFNKPFTAIINI